MRTVICPKLVLLLLVIAGVYLSGCSMVMYGIGSAMDNNASKTKKVPDRQWSTIAPGSPVTVIRADRTMVKGKFVEFAEFEDAEYRDRFAGVADTNSDFALLPRPGESAILTLSNSEQVTGELVGYDFLPRILVFREAVDGPDLRTAYDTARGLAGAVNIRNPTTGVVQRFTVQQFASLSRPDSPSLPAERLSDWMQDHRVPFVSSILVGENKARTSIPLDQIDSILVQQHSHFKWIFGGIGLAIDAAAVALAIALSDNEIGLGIGGGIY